MKYTRVLDSDELSTNLSDNEHFQEVVERVRGRRGFLKSGLGLSAAMFLAGPLAACGGSGGADGAEGPGEPSSLLGFKPVPISIADTHVIAQGYTATPFARWGEPLFSGVEWKGDGSDTSAAQARQVGDNHDGIHFFSMTPDNNDEGLVVMNHEYATTIGGAEGLYVWLFGKDDTGPASNDLAFKQERSQKVINAHGVSVIHIKKNIDGKWEIQIDSPYNRRITADTEMELAGPARGDALLQTNAEPTGTKALGTFNNCGNGWTPWGTYLTCEENFNNYFGTTTAPAPALDPSQSRYGITKGLTDYGWEQAFERFDYVQEPNEANRFGWIVEIDPFRPDSMPQKRTALGRIKHENSAYRLAGDNRIVIYMGDDQAGDYIYKFVSENSYREGADNSTLLDTGKLYVAKFEDGDTDGDFMGTGQWMLLDQAENDLLRLNASFPNQAAVLVNTRLAADVLGATPMDRPEWVAVHPVSGEVYVTLTNNSGRKQEEVDDANPRAANLFGQIIRWREAGGDAAALTFEWDLFVLAGNPIKYADRTDLKSGSENVTADNTFNSPDGLGFDKDGRLWIQTDGSYSNADDYEGQGNNQMLCADPGSKEIRRFFVGPKECEVTGIAFTPDSKTMFINIQHPGERGDSSWPDGEGALPRSATVIITKDDGGVIGT
ncbi:PhoX family protein [Pusillimonas sp.]|uniref:PhoX family protein n=1 Tax=Pusillimonas sp. TaxID=3040095 RepID=UPI0037CA44F5